MKMEVTYHTRTYKVKKSSKAIPVTGGGGL
jgi:hypothetical protein